MANHTKIRNVRLSKELDSEIAKLATSLNYSGSSDFIRYALRKEVNLHKKRKVLIKII